jgi:hypothetical protein
MSAPDYRKPGDEVEIGGHVFIRQPDEARYRHSENACLCPVCGGNKNVTECRCETRGTDPRLAPLEALRRLQ